MSPLTDLGRYLLMLKGMISKPENFKVYWKEFMQQCAEVGIGSLGIVTVISTFIGAVSTVQTAYQLVSPLLPKYVIGQIVREGMLLEFAPTLVCIVLAGVVGSKISSELGNMRVSEQIDALEIMGVNTKTYLVLPKILASVITIPFLIVLSAFLGILGGRIVGDIAGIISPTVYDFGLMESFNSFSVHFMIIKSYVFSFIISSISAYYGYYVNGGALEIGRSGTRAVVVCCVTILLSDYVLTLLLLAQ
ncbi:MAG TPA: ABC transporter permease [Chitinophagaceae bacterium]|nr:ABC transporter permease [Chitinophagaceae bacterium]